MSILDFRYLHALLVIAFASAQGFAQSSGNDVYNFYFQKGEAPQNVYQGGGGQASSTPAAPPALLTPSPLTALPEASPAAPATKQEMASPSLPIKKDYNTYELHLGPTRMKDSVGEGTAYTVGGQLNFNRYLGARLQGQYLASESADYSRPVNHINQSSNRWGGLAAVVFTPLRMDLVGHSLIRISAIGGLRTERRFRNLVDDQIKTRIEPFVGASVGVSINENVGVEGSMAMTDGGKIGQGTGSLVFSF